MAQNDKPSDVVRIVRIVSPTVLIIALALIFKSEIGGSLNRGCFKIVVKDIGVDFSDKSLCTAKDIDDLANELTQLGARKAEEQANVAFAEYENELRTLAEKNKTLQEKTLMLAEVNNANSAKIKSFQRELQTYVRETRSQEFTQFYNAYVKTFDPAVSIISDRNQKKKHDIGFLNLFGTFCCNLRIPVLDKEDLPDEDILPSNTYFT